jgi:hypothetical protein
VTNRWVPHISLVFGEMWDTTKLDLKCSLWVESLGAIAVVSHILRKTSEMWGTQRFVAG